MVHVSKNKQIVLLFAFLLLAILGTAHGNGLQEGPSNINIKVAQVQGNPKTNTIQASINGHVLTVTFSENLGDVQIDITTASGGAVSYGHVWTPNSYIAYIPNTGDYVVTITLGNGDEYYGEFEVTD